MYSTVCKAAAMAAVLFASIAPSTAEYYLGTLSNLKDFELAGDVYVMSDRVLEVRNFHYKGGAPDPFFWADSTPETPTQKGFILQDTSPTLSCGSVIIPATESTPFSNTTTYRLEFPDETSIYDVLGGTISLWCRAMFVNLGSIDLPEDLPEDLDLEETDDDDLQCSGQATDRFSLYDRVVVPITFMFNNLWGGISNFFSDDGVAEISKLRH